MNLLLVLALAALPSDLSRAARELAAAIDDTDYEAARPPIQLIQEENNRRAVDTLLEALARCTTVNEGFVAEQKEIFEKMRALQPDPNTPVKGRKNRDQMDALWVAYYKLSARFVHLADVRTAVAGAVTTMDAKLVARELSTRLSRKGHELDRAFAAETLCRVKGAESKATLLKTLSREKQALVKVAIIDGLHGTKLHDPETMKAVARHLDDEYWQVSLAAARFLEATKSPDAIPHLISGLKSVAPRARNEINEALITLTGVDKKGNHAAWADWWKRSEAAVRAGSYTAPAGEAAKPGEGASTTFYGIPLHTDKVVFVVDYSNSMQSPARWIPADAASVASVRDDPANPLRGISLPEKPAKIDVARFELKRALAQMPDETKFNTVFFNHTVWPFSPHRLETLDRLTRFRAFEFIDETGLILGTDIYEALKSAFGYAGVLGAGMTLSTSDVDTIILVSDGLPWLREDMREKGVMDPERILKSVREWNKTHKIVIHTIGIHRLKDGEEPTSEPKEKGGKGGEFLKKLAEENGGTYVGR